MRCWPAALLLVVALWSLRLESPSSCIARNCPRQLAACLTSVDCSRALICVNKAPSDPANSVTCTHLYGNRVFDRFTDCALTEHHCVEPLPGNASEARVRSALEAQVRESPPPDIPPVAKLFTGTWFIALGLNPLFDTFDCQVHTFKPASDGSVQGNFSFRVPADDGTIITRVGAKRLVQPDPAMPSRLLLHLDPQRMRYEDVWFVLGAGLSGPEEDHFVALRYIGSNVGWECYGGANVYTRSGVRPKGRSARQALDVALGRANLTVARLTATDNTCS